MFLIEALNLMVLEVIFNTFKEEVGECRDTLKNLPYNFSRATFFARRAHACLRRLVLIGLRASKCWTHVYMTGLVVSCF